MSATLRTRKRRLKAGCSQDWLPHHSCGTVTRIAALPAISSLSGVPAGSVKKPKKPLAFASASLYLQSCASYCRVGGTAGSAGAPA
jgi:hypothetical protein